MEETIFQKIIKGEIPAEKIYEDDTFFAFLDANPVNPGHTLLIPKYAFKDIYEIPDEIFSKLGPVLKKLAIVVKKATGADGINIMMNNEEPAGQKVFHAHFHIIPRFKGDGFEHWHGSPYKEKGAFEIAEKIRSQID